MQFIYPVALFALTSLMIPLLIHLWNVKTGKTLKIGSVLLLEYNSKSSEKSYRLSDWVLYLLRSLLLLLLVFILAEPFYESVAGKTNQKGWILMERNQTNLVLEREYKKVDSLVALGYEIHLFEKGFPAFNLGKDKFDIESPISKNNLLSYSSLLKQLSTVLPNDFPVYLYSDSRLSRFGNELPKVGVDLHWLEIKTADSLESWLTQGISHVYEAKSGSNATYYEQVGDPKRTVLHVLVHESFQENDAKYISTALSAIAEFTQSELQVSRWNRQDLGVENAEIDIAFWLSELDPDSAFIAKVKNGGRLFSYEKGKETISKSFLHSLGSGFGNEKFISLYKRIDVQEYKGEPLWVDGYGNHLLSVEKQANYKRFYFYSKLNPQWTDLVWSDQFLNLLLPVLMGDEKNGNNFGYEDHPLDRRLWANGQEIVMSKNNKIVKKQAPLERVIKATSAVTTLWVIALLVFMLERVLTFRRKKEVQLG